ncbi:hypothetical protein [Streptomyces sp. NPDC093514]|uniref:DUF7848 domain-containing protein n=1 Tax=Streptomyces sp. NPDC093514 TaxID=3366039 RepID=UPI00382B8954
MEREALPEIGTLVVDSDDRIGLVKGHKGSLVQLEPPGGGAGWDATSQNVQPAGEGERLRARVAEANARTRAGGLRRSTYRFVPHTLGLDPDAESGIFEVECTTCHAQSAPAADGREGGELWALAHTGRTGHTGYRAMTTSFWRATRSE